MDLMIYSILSVRNSAGKLNLLLSGMTGISGTNLYAIPFDEICAVVGDIPKDGLTAQGPKVLMYAEVVETLGEQFTLLPMRFGSRMETGLAVRNMLERNYFDIHSNLLKVENRYEFGLKVLCNSEKLKAELLAKTGACIQAPVRPAQAAEISVYREYVNRKLEEHRLEELVLAYVDSVIAKINGYLSVFNTEQKTRKMPTASVMIDSVFLIEREHKDTLVQVIDRMQNHYPSLDFVLTGPWPPYSFVETTIK